MKKIFLISLIVFPLNNTIAMEGDKETMNGEITNGLSSYSEGNYLNDKIDKLNSINSGEIVLPKMLSKLMDKYKYMPLKPPKKPACGPFSTCIPLVAADQLVEDSNQKKRPYNYFLDEINYQFKVNANYGKGAF